MDQDRDVLLYLGLGVLASVLLGVALMPLRSVTIASNFTFAFFVLVVVVAEFGGRVAAVGTALASALSLDFFLTQPYLRLSIADKHDAIAFVGLAVCGLAAAALGSQRAARSAALRRAQFHLAVLHTAAAALERPAPTTVEGLAESLAATLEETRGAFPLAAVVLRDPDNEVIAAATGGRGPLAPGVVFLEREALGPAGARRPGASRRRAVPSEGGRILLVAQSHRVGWLDVYGKGTAMGPACWRALGDVARLLAAMMSSARPRRQVRT